MRTRQAHQHAVQPLHVRGGIRELPALGERGLIVKELRQLGELLGVARACRDTSRADGSTLSSSTGFDSGTFCPAACEHAAHVGAELVLASTSTAGESLQARADAHVAHAIAERILHALEQRLALLVRPLPAAALSASLASAPSSRSPRAASLKLLALELLRAGPSPTRRCGRRAAALRCLRSLQLLDVRAGCAPRRGYRAMT